MDSEKYQCQKTNLPARQGQANHEMHGIDQDGIDQDRSMMSSGFLPPPEVLEKYRDVDPDLVKIIVDECLIQRAHRRAIEKRESEAATFRTRVTSLAVPAWLFAALGTAAFLVHIGDVGLGEVLVVNLLLLRARAKS